MAKNHPLIKDVKNWVLDSFSFMDGIGYDIQFTDDIFGMENTKAISADIDGLTDFDFEKGKKNLLNSVPNKIKAEFPYLRISSARDGNYFVMFITLLDNNDYLEDANLTYINLNESKKSSRKSINESDDDINNTAYFDRVAGELHSWYVCYVEDYERKYEYGFENEKECINWIKKNGFDLDTSMIESKKSSRKSIKESLNFKKDYAVEVMGGTDWFKPFYWFFNEFRDDLLTASEEYGFTYYITEATTTDYRINIKFNDNLNVSYDIKFRIIAKSDKATANELNDYLN